MQETIPMRFSLYFSDHFVNEKSHAAFVDPGFVLLPTPMKTLHNTLGLLYHRVWNCSDIDRKLFEKRELYLNCFEEQEMCLQVTRTFNSWWNSAFPGIWLRAKCSPRHKGSCVVLACSVCTSDTKPSFWWCFLLSFCWMVALQEKTVIMLFHLVTFVLTHCIYLFMTNTFIIGKYLWNYIISPCILFSHFIKHSMDSWGHHLVVSPLFQGNWFQGNCDAYVRFLQTFLLALSTFVTLLLYGISKIY